MSVAELACGCRFDVTDNACLIDPADQCTECRSTSEVAEERVQRMLDHELEVYVHAAAGGKRVQRIGPADPYAKTRRA